MKTQLLPQQKPEASTIRQDSIDLSVSKMATDKPNHHFGHSKSLFIKDKMPDCPFVRFVRQDFETLPEKSHHLGGAL